MLPRNINVMSVKNMKKSESSRNGNELRKGFVEKVHPPDVARVINKRICVHVLSVVYTLGDSDVISSHHIYAGCFSAVTWDKLCEMFVTLTTLFSMIMTNTGIFLNQMIQFYSNNETDLRRLTSHSAPCCLTTQRSYCDHRLL